MEKKHGIPVVTGTTREKVSDPAGSGRVLIEVSERVFLQDTTMEKMAKEIWYPSGY